MMKGRSRGVINSAPLMTDDLISDEIKHIFKPVEDLKKFFEFYMICENSLVDSFDKLLELIKDDKENPHLQQ